MFHVVLYQPEIPPNTGNVMRLCANTGAALHLVHPLGFSLEQRQLRRAGLDYRDLANVSEHASLEAAFTALGVPPGMAGSASLATPGGEAVRSGTGHERTSMPAGSGAPQVFAFSTRGTRSHVAATYRAGDVLLFGPETRGLPDQVLHSLPPSQRLRLPMRPYSRSLNLSNAVAVAVYEAWRQLGFDGEGVR